MGTVGADQNVTQMLQTASAKQAERKKKEDQDRQFAAAQTLVDAGNFAGATQVLNQAMATQIFERSDPRVQQQLRTIEQLSSATKSRPAADPRLHATPPTARGIPAGEGKNSESVSRRDEAHPESGSPSFSATMVGSPSAGANAQTPPAPLSDRAGRHASLSKEALFPPRPADPGKTPVARPSEGVGGKQSDNLFAPTPVVTEQAAERVVKRPLIPPEVLAQIWSLIKKPAALAGIGGALIVILIVVLAAGRLRGGSEKEKGLGDQAEQF